MVYTIGIVSSSRFQWCRARCNSTKTQKPAPHLAFSPPFPYLGVAPWVLMLSRRGLYHWNRLIESVPMVYSTLQYHQNPKTRAPPSLFPTISIFGGSSMGFDAITAWSIPLESSHRAGSNGVEHVAIAPKPKNPRPTKPFPHHFHIWGESQRL